MRIFFVILYVAFMMVVPVYAEDAQLSSIYDDYGTPRSLAEYEVGNSGNIDLDGCVKFLEWAKNRDNVVFGSVHGGRFNFDIGDLSYVDSCFVELAENNIWYFSIVKCVDGGVGYYVSTDGDHSYVLGDTSSPVYMYKCFMDADQAYETCRETGGTIDEDIQGMTAECVCEAHSEITEDGVECFDDTGGNSNNVDISGILTVYGNKLSETDGDTYTIYSKDCEEFMGKDNVEYGFIYNDTYYRFSFDFDEELQNVETCWVQYSESKKKWYVGIAYCEGDFYSYSVYDEDNMLTYQYNDAGYEDVVTGFKCIEKSVAESMCNGEEYIKEIAEGDRAWYCDCEEQGKQPKTTDQGVSCIEADPAEQAKTLIDKLDPVYNRISGQKSVWKNKEGDFNTSRLISDGVAAVVLGTAGAVVTSNIVKKNQIKYGFEDLKCHIGGQPVAGYGDAFRVGQ